MDHTQYPENGGRRRSRHPHFLYVYYGPSVACTVGCTWLMYSLCMAHIWPMYDRHMAHMWAIHGHIKGSGDLSNIGHMAMSGAGDLWL